MDRKSSKSRERRLRKGNLFLKAKDLTMKEQKKLRIGLTVRVISIKNRLVSATQRANIKMLQKPSFNPKLLW